MNIQLKVTRNIKVAIERVKDNATQSLAQEKG